MGKGARETVTVTEKDVATVRGGSVGTLSGDGTLIIAASAMTSVGHARMSGNHRPQNAAAKYIERCQIVAQLHCHELGITDPDVIRAKKLEGKRIGEEQLRLAIEKMNREAAEKLEADAKYTNARVEAAEQECREKGITDQDVINDAKLEARRLAEGTLVKRDEKLAAEARAAAEKREAEDAKAAGEVGS